MAKPILKWIGSKSRIVDKIIPKYINPKKIKGRYIEPFLGSCSLPIVINLEGMILNDINKGLIRLYKTVSEYPLEVCREIKKLREKFNNKEDKKEYYYKLRNIYNLIDKNIEYDILQAALFWVINKTCFNGMYREDSKGNYNIPYGKRDCSEIDVLNLLEFSKVLKKSYLRNEDYSSICKEAKKGDLVYLDPPYIPLSKTSNFEGYVKNGFGLEEHKKLCIIMKEMNNKGAKVVMSNSNSEKTLETYSELKNYGFYFNKISVNRLVSGLSKGRGIIKELIITNLECKENG